MGNKCGTYWLLTTKFYLHLKYIHNFFFFDNQQIILTKKPKTTEKKPKSYVLALEQYIRLVVMY